MVGGAIDFHCQRSATSRMLSPRRSDIWSDPWGQSPARRGKITLFDFDDAPVHGSRDDMLTLMSYLVHVYGGEGAACSENPQHGVLSLPCVR